MSTFNTVEAFSLSHAQILDGTTAADSVANSTFGDLYGVSNAAITPDTGNFDNTGDDSVLSTWNWFNFATVQVEAGYISFDMVALLSGSTQTSSGVGANATFQLDLWNEASLNTPPRPMLVRIPSKDADGTSRTLDLVLYKVQFGPMNFNGPTYKSGLRVTYSGKALMSAKDEMGNPLVTRAVGKMISRPGVLV